MPADSVNNTSFFDPRLDGLDCDRKPTDKTGFSAQSRLVRETDLNTIQGYIVKQEYPLFQQNPSLRHSFSIPVPVGYSLPQRISYFSRCTSRTGSMMICLPVEPWR